MVCIHLQVLEAATLANADEFVRRFPLGYQTVVGEKGHSVSGGQKQRYVHVCGVCITANKQCPVIVYCVYLVVELVLSLGKFAG